MYALDHDGFEVPTFAGFTFLMRAYRAATSVRPLEML